MKLSVSSVILMISIFLLVAVGSAYFIFWLLTDHFGSIDNPVVPAIKPLGPTFELGEITVNLSSENGGKSGGYVRVVIVLEVSDKKCINELNTRLPQIRDLVITAFRQYTAKELSEDSSCQTIKQDIKDAINPLLAEGIVTNVFFTSLAVQ